MSHVVRDLAGSVRSVPARFVCCTHHKLYMGPHIFPIVLTLLNGFTMCIEAGE
jgi:hypothetical protein